MRSVAEVVVLITSGGRVDVEADGVVWSEITFPALSLTIKSMEGSREVRQETVSRIILVTSRIKISFFISALLVELNTT
jgi:hypothetical protein